jgi:hypothetical protein
VCKPIIILVFLNKKHTGEIMMNIMAAADYEYCFKEFGFEEEVNEDNFYVPSESEYVSADEVYYEEKELEEWDIAA